MADVGIYKEIVIYSSYINISKLALELDVVKILLNTFMMHAY